MRMKTGAMVLAGVLFGGAALLPAVSEGRGGAGRGGRCGQAACQQNTQDCPQDRQRLRDGSCGKDSCPQGVQGTRKGRCNGPGSGCGNPEAGPKDGTGNGAPPLR